ncbi:MAG: SH3 domain-containing protein, partial [Cyanobacteria bacterium J06638_20]
MAGVAKFFLGFVLAIAIIFFAGVTTARYFVNRLTEAPPRPVFPNDAPPPPDPAEATAAAPVNPEELAPETAAAPEPTPSPEPTVSPEPTPNPGNVERVVVPIGLILREDATQASAQIGGIPYDGEVEVLESSPDGEWQRVRVLDSGQEGWIKSGNTIAAP